MAKDARRVAYFAQRSNAKKRGIEFLLSFEEWVEWWGADIDKRGVGPEDLQMCRTNDSGPYALGNIYKGTQKENSKTAGNTLRNRAAERNKRRHQQYLDALIWAQSAESPADDEVLDDDKMQILYATGAANSGDRGSSTVFAADKR